MIDFDKATEAAAAAYPDKDPDRIRETIKSLVQDVRAADVSPGDFFFQSTYGIHVQKIWFANEPEPDAVHVFVAVGSDHDLGEVV